MRVPYQWVLIGVGVCLCSAIAVVANKSIENAWKSVKIASNHTRAPVKFASKGAGAVSNLLVVMRLLLC